MTSPLVTVTGANGLVGSATCRALLARGATVRGVVRTAGTAPDGVEELVGDFHEPDVADAAVAGAHAVVSTVHPLGGDADTQRRVAVEGTPRLARAAAAAGVPLLVHVSTAAVYERAATTGDVDEDGALVDDDADAYALTKRDTDLALAGVDGLTTVLLRPPAVLGPGPTSVWNTLRPQAIRDDEDQRRDVPERTFAWVHVDDLAAFAAALAVGEVGTAERPAVGPVAGATTAVNVAAPRATAADYLGAVCDALGVAPDWQQGEAWTGRLVADRARAWGWTPEVGLDDAMAELRDGIAPA